MMNPNLTYLEFFHLRYNPFPVAPDTENFYVSRTIDRIITEIVHGIETRKGFMILVGEVGLGKTTIGRKIVSLLEQSGTETSLILQTGFQGEELLKEINRDFKIRPRSGTLGDHLRRLNDFLLKKNAEGRNCAIIIDDAQNLTPESLELIRMISNLETDREKLVQILLIGQPELLKKLATRELRQLNSRIIIHQEVKPLQKHELKDYLFFKLNAAGNDGTTTITNGGLNKIYAASKGNFRKVNAIMDRCLYAGFVCDSTRISRSIVKKALMDLKGKPIELYRRPLTWALAGMVALCLALAAPYAWKAVYFRETGRLVKAVPVEKEKGIPPQILNFLKDYGLASYGDVFFKALTQHKIREVAHRILNETGFYLIQLPNVPETVKKRFGILAYPSEEGGGQRFFIFWKPEFWVKRFYYGYQGPEILRIQQILAGLSLYTDSIDGIVGKNLMKALVEFQKKMALPVTGYPDPDTLFLLCNMKEIPTYGASPASQKTTG
ncbi:MAG: AAA family ATPase [Deltaproteobacteria bacterium]|nr:AAA family ATPase [Deltaproteobacteria bacterium]MBW1928415.1 AAA family ATPase [Deltaproteobacteria bacterium]MBW2023786.1 AAA family ATPase [Deltaproteobacteria bacterium]MBW2124343.1 AAA family ATPase [Deltaproteobacteria bacterium]